jgi:hypothetical protein
VSIHLLATGKIFTSCNFQVSHAVHFLIFLILFYVSLKSSLMCITYVVVHMESQPRRQLSRLRRLTMTMFSYNSLKANDKK